MRLEECATCTGSGVKAGTRATTCGMCGGSGQVVSTVRTPLGNFQQVTVCQGCGGAGQSSTPCNTCGGDGRVRRSKRISLRVPAGVDSGSRLRVRGEGNAGRKGGPPGDLYVFITVRPDAELRRDGINILSTLTIPYTDAILGTSAKVRTVDGPVDLKIPPGIQPGSTLLMAKRGVPRLGNPTQKARARARTHARTHALARTRARHDVRLCGTCVGAQGDQLVTVEVTIPTRLTAAEKALVEQLSELGKKAN